MHVNAIFLVVYTLPLLSPSPGNQVLRMKLKVHVWGHGREGLCVQAEYWSLSPQSIGHCLALRHLLEVPLKGSPVQRKKGSCPRGWRRSLSFPRPGCGSIGPVWAWSCSGLRVGRRGEKSKVTNQGPLYPVCTEENMEAQGDPETRSGPQG